MKKISGIAVSIALVLLTIACSHNQALNEGKNPRLVTATQDLVEQGATLVPETPMPELATQTVTTTPEFTPAPEESDRTSYEISAELDYAAKTLSVREKVKLHNPLQQELDKLIFIIEPNRYPNGFQLVKAESVNREESLQYTLESNQLKLSLNPALAAGLDLELSFEYSLNLPAIPPPSDQYKPQPYGYTERQLNLVDWYLFLPPLDSNGQWIVHKPSYFGEFLVYPQSDFTIELELTNFPDGLLIAASAKDQGTDSAHHRYELKAARSFAVSLNGSFEVKSKTVGGITVYSYYSRLVPSAGEEALNATTAALELYSDRFGLYPHETMSVVEADFLDGMEFDGLYFLSNGFYNLYDGSPKGYLTFIAVHETAHQWWYGLVGNDQAMEPWLDEALCTFSEILYYEKYYPELVDWWWYYRVNFYEPAGFINQPVYDYSGFTPYRNAVYLRGAEFLNELRKSLGPDQFFTDLKTYLAKYSGKIATTQDLLQVFGFDGSNHSDLLDDYFKPAE